MLLTVYALLLDKINIIIVIIIIIITLIITITLSCLL